MDTLLQVNAADKLARILLQSRAEQGRAETGNQKSEDQGDPESNSRSSSLFPHSWGILRNMDVLALCLFSKTQRTRVVHVRHHDNPQ